MNKDKELEEAIKELESLSPSENAIKTVLQALEKLKQDNYKLDKENQKLFEININSIPKKRVEYRLQELLNKLARARLDGFYDEVRDIKQELLEDK